jgi:hypothetical protein
MSGQNKFHQGKIYRITDKGANKVYIGSTYKNLKDRFRRHRNMYHHYLRGHLNYVSVFMIFEEFGIENCEIQLIEAYPCETLKELRKKEGEHIIGNTCVNRKISGRSQRDWYTDNKEYVQNRYKRYYEKNHERLCEAFSLYYKHRKDHINQKFDCQCGGKYTFVNKNKHRKSIKQKNVVAEG